MLTLNWISNTDNVAYCKENEIIPQLSRNLGIFDLDQQVKNFREHPIPEGIVLRGEKRSSAKLFIPNLYFKKTIEMGENVWLYMGDMSPAYCIYIPGESEAAE